MDDAIQIVIRNPQPEGARCLVSVIVPLAPNEPEPDALMACLPDDFEILLARGGTRASSMNRAALQASGAHLWFVHADSVLDDGAVAALIGRLQEPGEALHYFDLRFDGGALMRITELGVWFRSRCLGIPFGDQALCIPAASFLSLGCYDELALCGEDHLLVRQAHRAGLPVRSVGAIIITSARKYQKQGWFRTTGQHLLMTLQQIRGARRPHWPKQTTKT